MGSTVLDYRKMSVRKTSTDPERMPLTKGEKIRQRTILVKKPSGVVKAVELPNKRKLNVVLGRAELVMREAREEAIQWLKDNRPAELMPHKRF